MQLRKRVTRATHRLIGSIGVLLLAALIGCSEAGAGGDSGDDSGNDSGAGGGRAPLEESVDHSLNEGEEENIYTVESPAAGEYEIAVTGFSSDMDVDWVLYDNKPDAQALATDSGVVAASDSSEDGAETSTVTLDGSSEYFLVVYDFNEVGGEYTLTITPPEDALDRGDDDNSGKEEFGEDSEEEEEDPNGTEGDSDGGDTTAEAPSDAAGYADGSAYNYMEFIRDGEFAGDDTYSSTGIVLYESASAATGTVDDTGMLVVIVLDEDTDSGSIADGTYDVKTSEDFNAGVVSPPYAAGFVLYAGGSSDFTGSYDYAAATGSSASSTLNEGASATTFTELTGGTIDVSSSGGTYTVEWTLQTAGGETISGSYSGAPDTVTDNR